jgi:microcystin-dependent protein
MPSSNGVYSLPPGYLAATGTTIQVSQHNPIFEDVAAALTLRLSRDGTAPMTGPINLAAGSPVAPSLIFLGNVQSGFYPTATPGIGVGINGTQVAEFTAGGVTGVREVGELVPWTGSSAPSDLWALPFGQTLSRAAQPELWAFAQIEIAAGNTLYNNGDGATTFGIPDMRGCVPAGLDNMGGTAAGRLTTAGSGVNGAVLGSNGGAQSETLTLAQTPAGIASSGVNSIAVFANGNSSLEVPVAAAGWNDSGASLPGGGTQVPTTSSSIIAANAFSGNNTISVGSTNTGGGAHANVQPTLIVNYILFVGD